MSQAHARRNARQRNWLDYVKMFRKLPVRLITSTALRTEPVHLKPAIQTVAGPAGPRAQHIPTIQQQSSLMLWYDASSVPFLDGALPLKGVQVPSASHGM